MNKKTFRELVKFQVFTSRGVRINAMYFGWESGEDYRGFKFAVYGNTKDLSKQELFDLFYLWVEREQANLPYYVQYKFAKTNKDRFKMPISISTFN